MKLSRSNQNIYNLRGCKNFWGRCQMYLGGGANHFWGGGVHPPAPPENLCLPDSIDRKDILFGSFIRVQEE